jgi:hypothetical protein
LWVSIPLPEFEALGARVQAAEVMAKMDELENAETSKPTVAEYDVIWTKLRNWLEANA